MLLYRVYQCLADGAAQLVLCAFRHIVSRKGAVAESAFNEVSLFRWRFCRCQGVAACWPHLIRSHGCRGVVVQLEVRSHYLFTHGAISTEMARAPVASKEPFVFHQCSTGALPCQQSRSCRDVPIA